VRELGDYPFPRTSSEPGHGIAVFDSGSQHLLWERSLNPAATFGVVGDAIVIMRVGGRYSGREVYDVGY